MIMKKSYKFVQIAIGMTILTPVVLWLPSFFAGVASVQNISEFKSPVSLVQEPKGTDFGRETYSIFL